MKEELKDGAPAGTVFHCNESGWMDTDRFIIWLRHFVSVVKPTRDETVILILDGYVLHTRNLAAIVMAQENGVIMLSLPPHTTYRLQPLDVSVFKPLQTYYSQETEKLQRCHPGRRINTFRAATMSNAVNGFRKCGIWPCDTHVFDDEFQTHVFTTSAQSVLPIDLPTATMGAGADSDELVASVASDPSSDVQLEDHCYAQAVAMTEPMSTVSLYHRQSVRLMPTAN